MSKFISDYLPDSLFARLSRSKSLDHAGHAIVVCSVDEHGWPHPAMLTTLEVVARDARNIRLAMHGRSRTARNMQTNGMLTLILADEHGVFYVKGDVRLTAPSITSAPDLAAFNLRVDSVLEDNPAAYEKAHVATGITVVRDDVEHTRAEAVLAELLAD